MTENQRRYQKARDAYIRRAKKWHQDNKERSKELKKRWKVNNRDKVALARKQQQWRRAGIELTHTQYDQLLTQQGGVCVPFVRGSGNGSWLLTTIMILE